MTRARALESDWETAERIDWILYGTGIAALAAGTALWFMLTPEETEVPLAIRPVFSQSSAGISIWGDF